MDSTAVAEITELEHAFLVAPDTDAALAFMDGEGHVRFDFVVPIQGVGPEALRTSFDLFFDNCKHPVGRFLALNVEASDTLGVAYSIMHFAWTDLRGQAQEGAFRVTHALRRRNGQWKIFHTHVSCPMNPATGMVEMNLRP